MENINGFLQFCDTISIEKSDMFQTVDLYEGQNIPQVILLILFIMMMNNKDYQSLPQVIIIYVLPYNCLPAIKWVFRFLYISRIFYPFCENCQPTNILSHYNHQISFRENQFSWILTHCTTCTKTYSIIVFINNYIIIIIGYKYHTCCW